MRCANPRHRCAGRATRALLLVLAVLPWPAHRAAAQPVTAAPEAAGPGGALAGLPRVEVFGGYSFLPRTDPAAGGEHGHGLATALALNLSRHWALVVDADWHSWTYPGDLDSVDFATLTIPPRPDAIYPYITPSYGAAGDLDVTLTYVSAGVRFRVPWRRLNAFGLALTEVQRSQWSEQDSAVACRAADTMCVAKISTEPASWGSNVPPVFNTWDRPLERYGDIVVGRSRSGAYSSGAWGFGFGGGADLSLGSHVGVRLIQVNYSLGGFGEGPGRKLRIKTGLLVKFG